MHHIYYIGYLIVNQYISIGLDRNCLVIYSNSMKFSLFLKPAFDDEDEEADQEEKRKDLSIFVQGQFQELVKRNLDVPVTVLH